MKASFVNKEVRGLTAKDLAIGEIGVPEDGYPNSIFLKTYDGIVDLNSPNNTWGPECPIRIRKVAKGTQILLTVE